MSDVKILVCTHKEAPMPKDDIFLPIQLGKADSSLNLPIQGDNEGDNISAKNPNYCELTALYWAWKNLPSDVEYVGLNHYRRYFVLDGSQKNSIITTLSSRDIDKTVVDSSTVKELLNQYDIILAEPLTFNYSIVGQYILNHIEEDMAVLNRVIEQKGDDSFKAFWRVMNSNKLSLYNMFITKRSTFDSYCEWLFEILSKFEANVRLSSYNRQARVMGYMGERLLNVYCEQHKLKVKHLPVYFVDDQSSCDIKRPSLSQRAKTRLRYRFSQHKIVNHLCPAHFENLLKLNNIEF